MSIATATGVQYASGQDFYDHILTDHYRNVVADARNNVTALRAMIPTYAGKERVGGRFITFPVRTKRNIGTNAVRFASGYVMPDPGSQGADQYSFKPRHIYGRVKIDAITWAETQLDVDRYIDVVDLELGGLADDMAVQDNRMLHNDGSGRLAEVVSNGGGAPGILTLRINQAIEGAATCTTEPTQWIEVGDRLGFCDAAGASLVITTVTAKTATTITVADTTGVAANDWVVRISAAGAAIESAAFKAEPMGLGGIFSDADVQDGTGLLSAGSAGIAGSDYFGSSSASWSFQGIDSDANTFNQAIVLDNAGVLRPLTEALLQYGFSEAEKRNNARIDLMLSGYEMRDTYVDILLPAKRFNNTLELKGGHKALDFNGIPWAVDRDCYRNRVKLLALKDAGFMEYEVAPLSFVDMGGGAKWGKTSFDDDNMQAAVVHRHQYGVDVRQRVGVNITDVMEIR